MAQAPIDIDITGMEKRPYALLLDVARQLPAAQLQVNGIERWQLAGVTWVPWGCTNIDTDVVGCNITNIKNLEGFPAIETQKAFLLVDGLACSTLSSDPAYMDQKLRERLDVYASAAFATELMRGTNGGPNSFKTNETTILGGGAARSLRLAFADLETHLASKLHGAKGVIHLTVAALALAAADGFVFFTDGGWVTATGHDVVADAGYDGSAPDGNAVSADQDWLYASGPVFYAITSIRPVGMRNDESTNIPRNIHEFFAERYGLVAFDPCAVGAVRATLA